jgi:concanavalin A-like lectin/glucanase superfamily protein
MIMRSFICFALLLLWTAREQTLLAQIPISQYEFNGDFTNSSSFEDLHGVPAPAGTFREGPDSATAPEGVPLFGLGVDGTPNGAVLLDGLDDWIDLTIAGLPGERVPAGSFSGPGLVSGTMMAWVKVNDPASAQSRWLMGNANGNDFQAWRFGWNGAQLEAMPQAADNPTSLFAVTDATSNTDWADSAWHHLAVQWDGVGDQANIYLDGAPLGDPIAGSSLTGANTQTPWELPMAIGARNNGGILEGFWDGAIDDLRVYAEALSDAQILTIFEETPIALLPDFDEDADVDGSDFLIWQRGFANGSTFEQGDANSDGMVDGTDLAIWQTAFGTLGAGPAAQISAVPEPQTLVLLLISALAAAGGRRLPGV